MPAFQARRPARLTYPELVALTAAVMALNAFAIDMMLPALGLIGDALGATRDNDRQLVVGVYLMSNGVSQIFSGPLVDRFGRRPVLLFALGGYIAGSMMSVVAMDFAGLLAARAFQGAAAATARVAAIAAVRDQCAGRAMAKVMSLAMTVFMAAPIIAPAIGQLVMDGAPGEQSWRAIFLALLIYGLAIAGWSALRLAETLSPENRRPLQLRPIIAAYREFAVDRVAMGYTLASALGFGALMGFVGASEQIFLGVFDVGRLFALCFASSAAALGLATFVNARLVERIGMRPIAHMALACFAAVNAAHVACAALFGDQLIVFMSFMCASFFCLGLIGPNSSALAMERMGHIAGAAAAANGFASTTIAGVLGTIIGRFFDGTTLPVVTGFLVLGIAALALIFWVEHGRLFRARGGAPARGQTETRPEGA